MLNMRTSLVSTSYSSFACFFRRWRAQCLCSGTYHSHLWCSFFPPHGSVSLGYLLPSLAGCWLNCILSSNHPPCNRAAFCIVVVFLHHHAPLRMLRTWVRFLALACQLQRRVMVDRPNSFFIVAFITHLSPIYTSFSSITNSDSW